MNLYNKWEKISRNQWFLVPVSVAFLILFYTLISGINRQESITTATQEGIAEEIIRFHVIANSDSKEDQELKLKVKDAIVENLSGYLENSKSIEETREIIEQQLPLVIQTAQKTMKEHGYFYNVTATLEQTYFPTKTYGDMTFPPGIYEALRVRLGEAKGKNWWCVMYPPLCFVDATYSVVPKESKNKLKNVLTEKEYKELITSGKVKVKPKFKIIEAIEKCISRIAS